MATNNYDRMLLGEKRQSSGIKDKAKQQRKAKKEKRINIVRIVALVLAVLWGLMTLGAVGTKAQAFFLGTFGWLGVAYALTVVVLMAVGLAGGKKKRKLSKNKKWIIAGACVMAFVVALFSHLWSSYAVFDAVSVEKGTVSYGDYLGAVYKNGSSTSGGALLSLLAYPFLNAVGLRLSGIILAVIFFGVLFSMIYPFWLTTKEQQIGRAHV